MEQEHKHKCDKGDSFWLWWDRGEWIFDTKDGLRGPEIFYCPFCGEKLE